jgi:hypothetical protein
MKSNRELGWINCKLNYNKQLKGLKLFKEAVVHHHLEVL